eukprot:242006-Chlamydomonas_euryale.AAC.8
MKPPGGDREDGVSGAVSGERCAWADTARLPGVEHGRCGRCESPESSQRGLHGGGEGREHGGVHQVAGNLDEGSMSAAECGS